MSLTGLAPGDDLAETGFIIWEIVGNGRRGREEGNDGFRFVVGRVTWGIFWAEPARGEETTGRVKGVAMEAEGRGQLGNYKAIINVRILRGRAGALKAGGD